MMPEETTDSPLPSLTTVERAVCVGAVSAFCTSFMISIMFYLPFIPDLFGPDAREARGELVAFLPMYLGYSFLIAFAAAWMGAITGPLVARTKNRSIGAAIGAAVFALIAICVLLVFCDVRDWPWQIYWVIHGAVTGYIAGGLATELPGHFKQRSRLHRLHFQLVYFLLPVFALVWWSWSTYSDRQIERTTEAKQNRVR